MPSLMFPPALLFLIGALVIPFLKGNLRRGFILLVPLLSLAQLTGLPIGSFLRIEFHDRYELGLLEVSMMRLAFAYVYAIIGFLASVFAIHLKKSAQHTAAFAYIGSSMGVVFAGDYFTLFVYWEIMAIASAAIIFLRNNRSSREAGFRYILVHVAGGACLMAGIVLQLHDTGSLALTTPTAPWAYYLILAGVALNAAVPPFSAWLSDAYPEGSTTGSVYLTTFTTKTAVFVLALLFAGDHLLIWAGAIMTIYGVVFATMENDIRRLLAYHIISQVGYMVCGVGLGTALALNGTTAHAFSHILYKALLFMGTGAVIEATGRRRMTELGGIWRAMPLTMIFYMVAGFSISGVPLFNGFISKSLIVSAAADNHMPVIELLLVLASVGTFFSTTLKLPFYTFFGKSSFAKNNGAKIKPLPKNMTIAMGGVAFLCILFGVYPDLLYRLLPFKVEYHPYTRDHVIGSMQILLATAFAFMLFKKQLGGHHTITLDTDWFYRKVGNAVVRFAAGPLMAFFRKAEQIQLSLAKTVAQYFRTPTLEMSTDLNTAKSSIVHTIQARQAIGLGVALALSVALIYLIFVIS